LRGGGIKPTAMALRSRGIRRRRQSPSVPFPAPEGGGGTAGTRRAGVPRFRRPLRGLGKGKEGGGLPTRTHSSQGIAVGFIPPPHTGLGHLLNCGGCLQMCYCTPGSGCAQSLSAGKAKCWMWPQAASSSLLSLAQSGSVWLSLAQSAQSSGHSGGASDWLPLRAAGTDPLPGPFAGHGHELCRA